MSKRKWYRTVITVEILSDEPMDFNDLDEVHYATTDGNCSGKWQYVTHNKRVSRKEMAKLLEEQGSDPSFLQCE